MDRPRRTTRQPVKTAKVLVTSDPAPRAAKRKVDPEQRLNTLLENSKSELASMELPVRIPLTLRYRHLKVFLHATMRSYRCSMGSLGHNQREYMANAFRRLSIPS